MNVTKIIAVLTAVVLVISLAACGSKTPDEPEIETTEPVSAAQEISTAVPDADVTEDATEAEVTEAEATEVVTEAAVTEEAEETTEAEDKVPETKEEIVEFYKAAAQKTNDAGVTCNTKMEMTALDGGSGAAGKAIDLFKPIAKSALENNSGTSDGITGGYKNLTADDVASATAKDDGKYTTVRINLKQQVDGMNGKSQEGHVGHAVSVLPGLQTALDELKGLDLDTTGGSVTLTYNNAYVDAKIDNETGKIVSGTWHFQVDIKIDNCTAKIGFLSAKLNGTTGTVTYTITL